MITFINSLALVAVTQIPLLLKLWLDYKGKTANYKLELYRKQLAAFQALHTLASSLHRSTDMLMILVSEGSLPNKDGDAIANSMIQLFNESFSKFQNVLNDSEFLLPAETLTSMSHFSTCAARILGKIIGVSHRSLPGLKLTDLWREQNEYFTLFLNQMRLVCGIDTLSSEVLKELNIASQHKMISHNFEQYPIAGESF